MRREKSTNQAPGRAPTNRVLIAAPESFPHGGGATARIHAYARGLMAAGVDVAVVCLKSTEDVERDTLNHSIKGFYEGIPFEYANGSLYRENTFTRRRLRDLRSALRLQRIVRGEAGQARADVILFANKAVWIVAAVLACRAAGSVCVLEKSEYPFVYAQKTIRLRLWAWFFTRFLYKLPDGVIVISTCLEEYFLARVRRGARVIRIPILVDMNAFSEERIGDGRDRKVLCYVGHLGHKGEVDGLIDAFCRIEARFPEWSLRVIGDSRDPSVLATLRLRVANLDLSDRIQFVGRVARDALPDLFREIGAFALPRASGIFSTAGFPTKLGEYLASGRPVIVTNTGDIPLFLQDGVDAFLVPPDDPDAFAARLAEVFADPAAARAVGLRGRETARQQFKTESQGRRLAAFLRGFHGAESVDIEVKP
jgi:glycosyltransferase involved in cell wall biosynthesis